MGASMPTHFPLKEASKEAGRAWGALSVNFGVFGLFWLFQAFFLGPNICKWKQQYKTKNENEKYPDFLLLSSSRA